MIGVHIQHRVTPLPLDEHIVIAAAERTMELQAAGGDLTVVLADDAQLRELNRRYLGVDAPTDVLSFASGESDPESGSLYRGDVVISIPRAEAQASVARHSLETEVQLLVVHGVLHLLGFDHADPAGKAAMWKAQDRALEILGLSGIVIQE